MRSTYVTTFCNFAHYVDTGRPIEHECYVIPTKLICAERDLDDWEKIHAIWHVWQRGNRGPTVCGRKYKGD